MAALLSACIVFQTGCSEKQPGTDANSDMAIIKSDLKTAEQTRDPKYRIYLLRHAHDIAGQLEVRWPDSEKVPVFLEKHGDKLESIPEQAYELSVQTRDMDSFKWAITRSAKDYTQYSELLKVWKMGKAWRDYFISEYPEKALPIFIDQAVDCNSIRFFNQYIEQFKASGYKLAFPLEKTRFNARFCRFFADMIKTAMQQEDSERIGFLIDHMPTRSSVPAIDPYTKKTMQDLGDYVCHELKDETLACGLVELGYDMNRVDIEKTGFGADFAKALAADPEHAITHVLKLNEWHGTLSAKETRFVLFLPDPVLRLVHKLHIAEATRISVKNANTDDALRLIKLREKTQPLTDYDYDQLLGWSLEYNNRAVFDYLKAQRIQVDLFEIDLPRLAGSQHLFRLYAPKILKKIYRTMDNKPKEDGTTFGRIHDLLTSHRPEAVLYVVKNHDLGDAWMETTDGRTLLMDVCEGGNLEAAKYLVEKKGADIHAETGYDEATFSLFGQSKGKEGRLTPLFFAAKSGNCELIRYLHSKRADVNARSSYGATPLMHAAEGNHLEAVKMLIAMGARVNATMDESQIPSEILEDGSHLKMSTAYRRARKNGNKEMLDILRKAGANPN